MNTTQRICSIFFLCLSSLPVLAQKEEDANCSTPDKKVQKQLELAAKTSDARLKSEYFGEAIKLGPDNVYPYYDFAMHAYQEAIKNLNSGLNINMAQRQLNRAKDLFQQADERCDNFHSNIPYYIGIIFYYQKNVPDALPYFERFLAFKSSDMSKYTEDFAKKKNDIRALIQQYNEGQELLEKKVPYNPKIVENVSSPSDEYFPMLSPDNELMFFSRKVDKRNLGDLTSRVVEEFTYADRASALVKFSKGTPFAAPFNDGTFKSYGASTVSVDNKEMIMCACKEEIYSNQNYLNCDLYITYYERSGEGGNDFKWTPLKNMGEGINTRNGWEGQPTLSADGNTLYYTANRPSTQLDDIFVSKRDKNGKWSIGVPFTEMNTAGKDKSPFLHQDSETLYFVSSSSDTRKGVGGLDIFYSRNENGQWTKPKNIGYPINSENDELGIFVSADATQAYFSSNEEGNWNIYSFELYEEARPKPVVIVKGELKDQDGSPLKDAVVEVSYLDGAEKQSFRVNGDDGRYAAVVKVDKSQDIMLTVKKQDYAFESKVIEKENLVKVVETKNLNLEVSKIEKGKAYTIKDVLFETASSHVNARSAMILKQFVEFLELNPTIKIVVQGHTDDLGNEAENLELSKRRAGAVMRYLVEAGIDAQRLSFQGYGKTKPKVPNTNAVNRAINRRTDFLISEN